MLLDCYTVEPDVSADSTAHKLCMQIRQDRVRERQSYRSGSDSPVHRKVGLIAERSPSLGGVLRTVGNACASSGHLRTKTQNEKQKCMNFDHTQ